MIAMMPTVLVAIYVVQLEQERRECSCQCDLFEDEAVSNEEKAFFKGVAFSPTFLILYSERKQHEFDFIFLFILKL